MPAPGDRTWNVPVNANCQVLDVLNAIADFNCTTAQVPSTSLSVNVAPGQFTKQGGSLVTYAGTTIAATASATSVLYLDGTASWVATVAASYPTTAHLRIATIVAGASTITSITDNRQSFTPSGAWFDGTIINVGATTGLQLGSASTQKIGFMGATPISQLTFGVKTAGATYTSNEELMIQTMWNAFRSLGFGS